LWSLYDHNAGATGELRPRSALWSLYDHNAGVTGESWPRSALWSLYDHSADIMGNRDARSALWLLYDNAHRPAAASPSRPDDHTSRTSTAGSEGGGRPGSPDVLSDDHNVDIKGRVRRPVDVVAAVRPKRRLRDRGGCDLDVVVVPVATASLTARR